MKRKVTVFVASSKENAGVVKMLSGMLQRARRMTFKILASEWTKAFPLSATNIESLEQATAEVDFAIVVLTANDFAVVRRAPFRIPRDNVVFELGLFMGALNRERCYMLYELGPRSPKIPSDLAGVTAATYPKRGPAGLERALAPACEEILNRIEEVLERSFVARIVGPWWERITTSEGFEVSFFQIIPDDRFETVHFAGDHFDRYGKLIGSWESVVVELRDTKSEVFYHWEGTHPPAHGRARRRAKKLAPEVEGYGTFKFSHATGRFKIGTGHFLDVAPNKFSMAQRKDVRLKREADQDIMEKMTDGNLEIKETTARKTLDEW